MSYFNLKLKSRLDNNIHPIAYSIENYVIIRTHPFYCSKSCHYGRCYRYSIINKSDVQLYPFHLYCYEKSVTKSLSLTDILDISMEKIFTNIAHNIKKSTITIGDISAITIKKTDEQQTLNDLANKMYNAQLPPNVIGFIKYCDWIYLIYENHGEESHGKESHGEESHGEESHGEETNGKEIPPNPEELPIEQQIDNAMIAMLYG